MVIKDKIKAYFVNSNYSHIFALSKKELFTASTKIVWQIINPHLKEFVLQKQKG